MPSKALLASAKAAHTMRMADQYGLPSVDPEIDTSLVWKRIRAIQQELAATDDNPERFGAMGVEIVAGPGPPRPAPTRCELVGRGPRAWRPGSSCCAPGSRPATPPIEGLAEAGFLTSENVFEIERAPAASS